MIAGTKIRRKHLGRAVEYCPICKAVSICSVWESSSVEHIYFIPLGRPKVLGREVACLTCKQRLVKWTHTTTSRNKNDSLEELIALTNPQIDDAALHQLTLEERATAGDITPAERFSLLHEPFFAIAHAFSRPHVWLDARATLVGVLAIVIPSAAMITSLYPPFGALHATPPWVAQLSLAILTALFLFTAATAPRRRLRHYANFLAESLAPLNPTERELDMVISAVRSKHFDFGRLLTPELVVRVLQDYAQRRAA